jgi:hypothetical protein
MAIHLPLFFQTETLPTPAFQKKLPSNLAEEYVRSRTSPTIAAEAPDEEHLRPRMGVYFGYHP